MLVSINPRTTSFSLSLSLQLSWTDLRLLSSTNNPCGAFLFEAEQIAGRRVSWEPSLRPSMSLLVLHLCHINFTQLSDTNFTQLCDTKWEPSLRPSMPLLVLHLCHINFTQLSDTNFTQLCDTKWEPSLRPSMPLLVLHLCHTNFTQLSDTNWEPSLRTDASLQSSLSSHEPSLSSHLARKTLNATSGTPPMSY